jgi:hypothetical protein
MVMRPHRRGIQEQRPCLGKGLGLQTFPDALPNPALLPAPEAHVDRMPVAQCRRQIPPGTTRAIQIKDGFDKLAITLIRRRARRGMFGRRDGRLQRLPKTIADQFSHSDGFHPLLGSGRRSLVDQIIREHGLEYFWKGCSRFQSSKFQVPSSKFQVQPAAGALRSEKRVLPG